MAGLRPTPSGPWSFSTTPDPDSGLPCRHYPSFTPVSTRSPVCVVPPLLHEHFATPVRVKAPDLLCPPFLRLTLCLWVSVSTPPEFSSSL